MYDNLWGNFDNTDAYKTTDAIKKILREQSERLKEVTDNKVNGKFGIIKQVGGISALETIASATKKMAGQEVIGDTNDVNLIDANSLYKNKRYGYEIYTNEYKFRVFELSLKPIYPITIKIDEGILEECGSDISLYARHDDGEFEIESDEDFIFIIARVFRSNKVHYIVSKLMADE